MEITLTALENDPLPEPIGYIKTEKPLLNSTFKAVSDKNYSEASSSIFGKRQRLKFSRFNNVNAVGVALKLSVFVMALALIF